MNEFSKSFLLTMAFNAGIFLLSFAAPVLFIIFFGLLVIELVIGFAFVLGEKSRQRGAAVLVASGVSFLIGLSLCSSLANGFH